jgi:hypothetical protein
VTRAATLALAALASTGCVELTGELRTRGGALGDHRWVTVACTSGAVHGFFGADLQVDAADAGASAKLRAISDVFHGERVRLYLPADGDRYVELTRADCSVLRIEVGLTEYTRGTSFDGRVDLDCHFGDRGTLDGEIQFNGCTR